MVHMCGVGWGVMGWGGAFKDVVVGHVEHTRHICVGWGGVWWGGEFKDVVVGHVEHTWYICVGSGGVWCGGVGRLKTLWLVTLSTRGTYVWGGAGWWGV